MKFDLDTLDKAALIATNQRLNKRCQRLEKLATKYRRRYVTIQNPARATLALAEDFLSRLRRLYREEVSSSICPLCRLRHWWLSWEKR